MARPPKLLDPGSSGLALFGSTLRMYREAAGETLAGLGAKINYSPSTVGEVERGESRCERALAERADDQLKTGGSLAHLWDHLVKAGVYPRWFENWPGIEEKAITLRSFQPLLVDGLLQTDDYARALLYGDEAAVAARMGRQTVLTKEDSSPPLLVCVLSEIALWHQVGNPKVMHDQLMHLVASISDRVSVHVVPNGVIHPGNAGAFVLATLADRSEVAYLETGARGITTGTRDDVTTLNESFEKIRNEALPVGQSMDLIRRTAEERWST